MPLLRSDSRTASYCFYQLGWFLDVNEDNEDVNEGGEGGFLEGRAHSSPLEHRLALTRLLHVLANPAAGRWTQIDAGSCNNVKYEPR